nr:MAG TPA: hypothetical protein [Caudoviricetes sp.]
MNQLIPPAFTMFSFTIITCTCSAGISAYSPVSNITPYTPS